MFIRLFGYFFGIGTAALLAVAVGVYIYAADLEKELPDYEVLNRYEPPVVTCGQQKLPRAAKEPLETATRREVAARSR